MIGWGYYINKKLNIYKIRYAQTEKDDVQTAEVKRQPSVDFVSVQRDSTQFE